MTNTSLLVVQAMQLSIVALIVVVSINPRLSKINKVNQTVSTGYISGLFRNYIAIGFFFNLCYLFFCIGSNYKLAWPEFYSWSPFWITLFDILTGCFFFLEAISDIPNRMVKRLIIGILFGTAFAIVIHNLHHSFIDIHIFNFIGYVSVSVYAIRHIKHSKKDINNIYFTYVIAIGFLMWSIIQLLSPIGEYFRINSATIQIVGFSVSTISKILILSGLYDYSTRISKDVTLALKAKNIELVEKIDAIEQLRKKQILQHEELNKKFDNINALPNLINEISNAKNTEELAANAVFHLTSEVIFKYDYAIFSEVDYLKQKITYKDAKKSPNSNIKSIEDWVAKEGIPFEHHDIMALVVKDRRPIHVIGTEMTRGGMEKIEIDISDPKSPLNKEVFLIYNHKNLDRYFIPILKLEEKSDGPSENVNDKPSRVVAIIEIGFDISNAQGYKNPDNDQMGELNIYCDNCSQSYERLVEEKIKENISSKLTDCSNESKDNHFEYLRLVMRQFCEMVNAEHSIITLYFENKSEIKSKSVSQYYNISENVKSRLASSVVTHIEKSLINLETLEQDAVKLEKQFLESTNTKSFFVKEIPINDYTICLWIFSVKREHFFNEVIQSIITRVANRISPSYNEKKFHFSVAKLVAPNNAITDLEINMLPIIDSPQDYFETPYISIWLKDGPASYSQKYGSFAYREIFKNFGKEKILSEKINFASEYNILHTDREISYLKGKQYQDFIFKTGVKTILQKPLKTEHQVFGFMNVFFKKKIEQISYEDITFLNLVSVKGLITIQINNLVNAFRAISDSFTRNDRKATLQTITDAAMELLNADPVILFESDNGTDVYFSDVTYSNIESFRNQDIVEIFRKRSTQHVGLAELVINEETIYFNNQKEYIQYVSKKQKKYSPVNFNQDFWNRESIKSMAAIKLSNKTGNIVRPVGVMFINFRSEIIFNDDLKRVIETFASFASGSMANGFIFQTHRDYILRTLRMTKPMLVDVTARAALHDTHKNYMVLTGNFFNLLKRIDADRSKLTIPDIRVDLENRKFEIENIFNQFKNLENFYRSNEKLAIKSYSLAKILQSKISTFKDEFEKKHIILTDNFSKKEIQIECEESLIGDMFFNIINNAYQALESRGHLEIKLEKTKDEFAKIDIIDDGKGISKDIKEIIAEPYISDKQGGSGLGLAMSKHYIQLHKGHLSWDSKKGKTVFTILLPIKQNIN